MESMRDVDRVMEREVAKGSCPLKLDRIKIETDVYQEIASREKLHDVLSYLLRVGDFKQYAGKTVNNNVYMDIKGGKPVFHRTKSGIERNNIFTAIRRYEKKLKPDYDGKVYLETAKCFFTIPEEDMIKYRYVNEGKETYAFTMSNKYILGLYTHCLTFRKNNTGFEKVDQSEKKNCELLKLESVSNVLFQSLELDNILYNNNEVSSNFHSIYLLK